MAGPRPRSSRLGPIEPAGGRPPKEGIMLWLHIRVWWTHPAGGRAAAALPALALFAVIVALAGSR